MYRKMDIVYQDNKHYLSKSMSFSSPSAAACFVLGARLDGMEGQERQNTR